MLHIGYNATDITVRYNAPHKTFQVTKTHPIIREVFCGFNSQKLSKNLNEVIPLCIYMCIYSNKMTLNKNSLSAVKTRCDD